MNSFELPWDRRTSTSIDNALNRNIRSSRQAFYNPTLENEYLLLWVIWRFFPPCTTVTPLILELLTVFNSHGVREQSLAILCPKQKNWLLAIKIFIPPTLSNDCLATVGKFTIFRPLCKSNSFYFGTMNGFMFPWDRRTSTSIDYARNRTNIGATQAFHSPTVENEYLLLWVIWRFFPPCITVTPLILELLTVINSHGVREQAPVILCPKQKNWLMAIMIIQAPWYKIAASILQ